MAGPATPRGGFGFGAVGSVFFPPLERLPRGVSGSEVRVRSHRAVAPQWRIGVERRGGENGRWVGQNAVEGKAVVRGELRALVGAAGWDRNGA